MFTSMHELLLLALGETLWMVFASALFGTILGVPLGIALHITKPGKLPHIRSLTKCWAPL